MKCTVGSSSSITNIITWLQYHCVLYIILLQNHNLRTASTFKWFGNYSPTPCPPDEGVSYDPSKETMMFLVVSLPVGIRSVSALMRFVSKVYQLGRTSLLVRPSPLPPPPTISINSTNLHILYSGRFSVHNIGYGGGEKRLASCAVNTEASNRRGSKIGKFIKQKKPIINITMEDVWSNSIINSASFST